VSRGTTAPVWLAEHPETMIVARDGQAKAYDQSTAALTQPRYSFENPNSLCKQGIATPNVCRPV
jgi:hypothetical protein